MMGNERRFLSSRKAIEILGVSPNALRSWADSGKIEAVRTPGGQRMYDVSKYVKDHANITKVVAHSVPGRQRVCYCRVSSIGQKDDLERQISFMRDRFPEHRIVRDIGSGINFKRRGLLNVLELANKGALEEVVVAHRDRLCRFAFDLLEWLLRSNGVRLLVLNPSNASTPGSELADDLMAIVQVFSCRANGRRKYSSAPEGMVAGRLRLYPDAATTAQLRRWFGSVRVTYNMALHRINTHKKTSNNTLRGATIR